MKFALESLFGRRKEVWFKWLKTSGAALLLIAFGMQTRQNALQAVDTEHLEANAIESRTHQKAIGYETLYFAAKATGIEQPQYLQFAARQYYIGAFSQITMILGKVALAQPETQARLHRLREALGKVHDLNSYQEYVTTDNAIFEQIQRDITTELVQPARSSKRYGNIYLSLYVMGSVLALAGQALEPLPSKS